MLTPREQEVVTHAAAGETSAGIGRELGISEHTVRKHLEHAYRKLGVRNRAAAVASALGAYIEVDEGIGCEQARRLREEAAALRNQADHQRRRAKLNIDQANRLVEQAKKLDEA